MEMCRVCVSCLRVFTDTGLASVDKSRVEKTALSGPARGTVLSIIASVEGACFLTNLLKDESSEGGQDVAVMLERQAVAGNFSDVKLCTKVAN